MGMAASQARLLTITARLADNELRSQTINNAKMRLASESAQASDDYVQALNEAQLMFRNTGIDGLTQNQVLTYNSLTAYSQYNTQYGLVNSAGQLLVSEADAKNFEKSGNNLENFLGCYGLKWDTSYFDAEGKDSTTIATKLGSFYFDKDLCDTNGNYYGLGALFADITYDKDNNQVHYGKDEDEVGYPGIFTNAELKELYESYLSIDNSIEKSDFQTYQSTYYAQKKNLYSVVKDYLQDKLFETAGNKSSMDEVYAAMYEKVKNKTKSDDVQKALWDAYIAAEATGIENILQTDPEDKSTPQKTFFEESINQIKIEGLNTNTPYINEPMHLDDYAITDEDGKVIGFQFGDFTFNYVYDGDNVTGISVNRSSSSTQSVKFFDPEKNLYSQYSTGFPMTIKATNITALMPSDKPLAIFDSSNTKLKDYSYSSAGDISEKTYYTNKPDALKDYIKTFVDKLINNSNVIDLDKFVENNSSTCSEFITARDNFYKLIFKDYSSFSKLKEKYTYTDTDTGEVTSSLFIDDTDTEDIDENFDAVSNILDFTNMIQLLLKNGILTRSELTDGSDVDLNPKFMNLIKGFVAELMLDLLGEPSYSWVDVNDKNVNEENAAAKAQWYINIFNRMRNGYSVLEDGLASSSKWIEHAFESGMVYMEQVDKSYNWIAMDYKTCANITEDTDNSAAVAIAEAKYNRAMNDIKRKDNMYDIQLKNIDTEHSALQTEYDVIKSVISKNIERTMKFDQSG